MSKDKTSPGGAGCPLRKTSIGGQALMEGIMMRGPKRTAMAVRNPQGEMVVETFPTSTGKASAVRRIPIVRGVFNFADSMIFGYRCLMRSAEISGLDDAQAEMEREKAERKAARKAAKGQGSKSPESDDTDITDRVEQTEQVEQAVQTGTLSEAPVSPTSTSEPEKAYATDGGKTDSDTQKKKNNMSGTTVLIMIVSVVLALALMVGLFILLPTWLYDLLARRADWMYDNRYAKSVFTGVLKILLLVGYMAAVSLMKEIRTTFRYHGAEHKTIFCYEKGLELTVENVRAQRRFHPRCGTSFLILMVLVSILVGFFIPPTLPTWLYSGIRILLVPIIVGLGYELIKFCGRHDNWLTRVISAPGVALQHITVFEPDDRMIECAIAAIREVIPEDGSDRW